MKVLVTLSLFAAFLLCPAACADGVREGLSLAAMQALPALFPFFVISGLLVRCGTGRLSSLLAHPLQWLYGLPPEAAPALVLGLIGGYPVGAATACSLYDEGALSRAAAERVGRFCNCASPGFCIALVGLGVFGSAKTGAALYGVHIVAALLAGMCFERYPLPAEPHSDTKPQSGSFASVFCASVQNAASTALTVTAFLTVFSILLRLVSPVFALLPNGNALDGLVELTNGLDELGTLPVPHAVRLTLASFLLGFGGLAVQFQVRALAEAHALPIRHLFAAKLLHGAFAAALTAVLFRISPAVLTAAVPELAPAPVRFRYTLAVLFVSALYPIWGWKKRGK